MCNQYEYIILFDWSYNEFNEIQYKVQCKYKFNVYLLCTINNVFYNIRIILNEISRIMVANKSS